MFPYLPMMFLLEPPVGDFPAGQGSQRSGLTLQLLFLLSLPSQLSLSGRPEVPNEHPENVWNITTTYDYIITILWLYCDYIGGMVIYHNLPLFKGRVYCQQPNRHHLSEASSERRPPPCWDLLRRPSCNISGLHWFCMVSRVVWVAAPAIPAPLSCTPEIFSYDFQPTTKQLPIPAINSSNLLLFEINLKAMFQ